MPSASVEYGDDGESRILEQVTKCEGHILLELGKIFGASHVSVPPPADVPAGCVDLVDVAEPAKRGFARLCRRHPLIDQLADPHLDVEFEFGIDLVLDTRPPERRAQGTAEPHAFERRTFETAAASRAQCCVSDARCRRPLEVMR